MGSEEASMNTWEDEQEMYRVHARLRERYNKLLDLFQRLLKAVAPTHSYWIDANPELVQEIRDEGFVVREWEHDTKEKP
jgi:hypothetical protein